MTTSAKLKIAIITILATAIILWLVFNASNPGKSARVIIDSEEVLVLDLSTDGIYEYFYGSVKMRFIVKDGMAAVYSSNCPDDLCVREGFLSRAGQMAVCLPNRAMLIVE